MTSQCIITPCHSLFVDIICKPGQSILIFGFIELNGLNRKNIVQQLYLSVHFVRNLTPQTELYINADFISMKLSSQSKSQGIIELRDENRS